MQAPLNAFGIIPISVQVSLATIGVCVFVRLLR